MSWLCALCATDNALKAPECEVCGELRPITLVSAGRGATRGTWSNSAGLHDLTAEAAEMGSVDPRNGAGVIAVGGDTKQTHKRPKAIIRVNVDGSSTTSFRSSELCKPVGKTSSVSKAAAELAVSSFASVNPAGFRAVGSLGTGVLVPKLSHSSIQNIVARPVLDESACATWEWPSSDDYPDREYQLQIVAAALFQNTLVSLPTGLGKTFIAAVVMYNYFRCVIALPSARSLCCIRTPHCMQVVPFRTSGFPGANASPCNSTD
jgi:hypothetical protein